MDFGNVLSRAWNITWKYKILWIFGILASCGNQAGSNSFNYSFDQRDFGRFRSDVPLPPGLQRFFFGITEWFERLSDAQIALFIAAAFLIALILFVLGLVLSTIGRIGLIQGALEVEQGATTLSFGELFGSARKFFWRVLGLNLLLSLLIIVFAILFAIFFVIATVGTLGLGLLCLLPLLCLLIPAGWFVSIIIEQANVALVVEDLGIVDAITHGWQVVRDNLGTMILMGLILLIGGLVVGVIIGLPVFLTFSPLFFGFISGTSDAVRSGLVISGICFVIYLPVLIVLSGILRTFISASWTLTYLRLTGAPTLEVEVFDELEEIEEIDEVLPEELDEHPPDEGD